MNGRVFAEVLKGVTNATEESDFRALVADTGEKADGHRAADAALAVRATAVTAFSDYAASRRARPARRLGAPAAAVRPAS